ncbi:sorting nexin-21 [Spea bombifrons]|uniref:sorting nexin-21 n=1 Tax=Spea bombifrons TaxID=233779 RepID=UPI00234A799B|nr:sorting nexin-21 [Spea bombifrons]
MAFKLLQRFRGSTMKEPRGPGPPEEPPESAELVDDTEVLSVRLSGTLSLSEDSLGSDESDDTETRALKERHQRTLLTQQLREMWANAQQHPMPIRLTFEVTEANVVHDAHAKYVVYTIFVLLSGKYDASPACISCRYSDLERLRRRLRTHYPDEMSDVSFPRKRLHRNFTAETIAKRSRAFEQFLCHVSSIPVLRWSGHFLGFFYLHEMQNAQRLTRTGLYKLALPLWTNIWHLQEKLCPSGHCAHKLVALAGLVVCHQEMETLVEAQVYSEQAIRLLQETVAPNCPWLVPFLHAHIQLSWRVGKDKRDSETALQKLQEAGHPTENVASLKEILITETIS